MYTNKWEIKPYNCVRINIPLIIVCIYHIYKKVKGLNPGHLNIGSPHLTTLDLLFDCVCRKCWFGVEHGP
jgi:hypothetical protein